MQAIRQEPHLRFHLMAAAFVLYFQRYFALERSEPVSYTHLQEVYAAANGVGYTVTITSKGYASDPLKVMVGIKEDGTIEKVKVLANNETPGLGSKVSNDEFVNQFNGMGSSMDGFEAIGGATLSSNAMRRAVETSFQVYEMVKGE